MGGPRADVNAVAGDHRRAFKFWFVAGRFDHVAALPRLLVESGWSVALIAAAPIRHHPGWACEPRTLQGSVAGISIPR